MILYLVFVDLLCFFRIGNTLFIAIIFTASKKCLGNIS